MHSRIFRGMGLWLVLGGLLASISGCGSFVTLDAWLGSESLELQNNEGIVVPAPEHLSAVETPQAAKQFALMALFAKVVYRKDLEEGVRKAQGCSYLDTGPLQLDVGMPEAHDMPGSEGEKTSGWRRWDGRVGTSVLVKPCVDRDGLFVETYVHYVRNRDGTGHETIDKAVLAFRGTENYSWSEKLADWTTNFSALLGLEPHEYTLAQTAVTRVVGALREHYGAVEVYATGHSLGGGLAQQAGYLDARIKAVYAFDTTPVTNWSNLQARQNREGAACKKALLDKPLPDTAAQDAALQSCKTLVIKNPYPTIYRVSHWNEGLAHVRNVTTRFNTRRFGRSDYEFFFEKDKPVAAHEMGILACHLSFLMPDDDMVFDYPKAFAQKVISKDYGKDFGITFAVHPVCPCGAVNLPDGRSACEPPGSH